MASRKLDDLVQECRDKAILFLEKCKEANINVLIIGTLRTQAEQDALYAQGRTTPGRIVTWTKQSKHIEGKAFDAVLLVNGKIDWNGKDYTQMGEIAESVGLTWGGRWPDRKTDTDHFQIS
jgi:peptidoglycan L-alanyl-D-glutamate endopeptidase CwlK